MAIWNRLNLLKFWLHRPISSESARSSTSESRSESDPDATQGRDALFDRRTLDSRLEISRESRRTPDLAVGRPRPGGRAVRILASGFTILEMLIVVGVLSIAALVVVPSSEPAAPYRLDLATSELAAAIRFARGEAIRTGRPHGVELDTSLETFRAFRAAPNDVPPTPIYDVNHPVSKLPYVGDLDDDSATRGVALAAESSFSAACNTPTRVVFDARGIPRCGDPWSVLLQAQTLTLTLGGHIQRILLEGETGRVRVQ
jgi:prepilin-type N-terminal cleavage/methylation domain-containing protein